MAKRMVAATEKVLAEVTGTAADSKLLVPAVEDIVQRCNLVRAWRA